MCGRFTINKDPSTIGDRFGVLFNEGLANRLNVKPSQQVPTVLLREGSRCGEGLRWGLVPHWAKDEKVGNRMINARAETLLEKPSFRDLVASAEGRCLIVADGFYEWMKAEGPKQKKTPMRYGLEGDKLFSIAGLWTTWTSHHGERVDSCTIITTTANDLVSAVHDRMPTILSDNESESAWLDATVDGDAATSLLGPLDSSLMYARVAEDLSGRSR